ncbi:DUF7701 domain-containing protein [Streptomyces sp. NPDC003388]
MSSYLSADAELVRSCLSPEVDPPSDTEDLFLLYALLMRSKGAAVTAADVHDAWSAWMLIRGVHHSALKPFENLDDATQKEDHPYVLAIRRAALVRNNEN